MRPLLRWISQAALVTLLAGCGATRMAGVGGKVGTASKVAVGGEGAAAASRASRVTRGGGATPSDSASPTPGPAQPTHADSERLSRTTWKLSDNRRLEARLYPWRQGVAQRTLAVAVTGPNVGPPITRLEASLTPDANDAPIWRPLTSSEEKIFTLDSTDLNHQVCIRLRARVGSQTIELTPWTVVIF